MTVHNIVGKQQFTEQVIEGSKERLVLLDCFATWCGPCKAIAPQISKWSEEAQFSNVGFYKIDVDESSDVAAELGIRAMPTFLLFKDGQKVGEVIGAAPQKIFAAMTAAL